MFWNRPEGQPGPIHPEEQFEHEDLIKVLVTRWIMEMYLVFRTLKMKN